MSVQQIQNDFPLLKVVDHTLTYKEEDSYNYDNKTIIIVCEGPHNASVFEGITDGSVEGQLLIMYLGNIMIITDYNPRVVRKWVDHVSRSESEKENCFICDETLSNISVICDTCGQSICSGCKVKYVKSLVARWNLPIPVDRDYIQVVVPCMFCNPRGLSSGGI